MKKVLIIIPLFILIFAIAGYAAITGDCRISLIKGDVLIQTYDTASEWVAASINTPVTDGDKIWVPDEGRLELQFTGSTYLRADENTEIEINRISINTDDRIIQIAMPQGRIYANYKGYYSRDSVLQIDTPIVSAMVYGDSRFDINVIENGATEISVFDGTVYVETQTGTTKVRAGNMITINPGDSAEISPRRPKDNWQSWNLSRDSFLLSNRTSSRYLPPSLSGYCSDLDQYGRWVYTPDYGYVWTPRLVVSTWAPYRHGRWAWIYDDYVWISYEPWGWIPYHYGRWAFRAGIGWFWVPPSVNAVFWSPGFVAWIYTPTYVSWVPLAPGEIYYGYGYYGPHSVNLRKVNVKNINITNIYINARVNNAVTVIHRDTFLTGRQVVIKNVPSNPFISGARVSPGRPEITPVRETRIPNPLKIVHEKSFPKRHIIEKTERYNIKERKPAINNNISVFRNDRPSKEINVRKLDYPKPAPKINIPKSEPKRVIENQEKQIRVRPSMPSEIKEKPILQDRNKSVHIPEKSIKIPEPREKTGNVVRKAMPDKHIEKPKTDSLKPIIRPRENPDGREIIKKPFSERQIIRNTF
jgi:hypothetical protein